MNKEKKKIEAAKTINAKIEKIIKKMVQMTKDLDSLKLQEEHDFALGDINKANKLIDEQLLQIEDLKKENSWMKKELKKSSNSKTFVPHR